MDDNLKFEDPAQEPSEYGLDTQRRFTLETKENTNSSLDYLVALSAKLPDELANVNIYYVPDKLLLRSDVFELYLHNFKDEETYSLEELALMILDDLNNELIPRWVQVSVNSDHEKHRVLIEDRQPIWENKDLLSRIEKF